MKKYFDDNLVSVVDGIANIKITLEEIKNESSAHKFFDLLNCDGGCIGSKDIINSDQDKNKKAWEVLQYKTKMETEDKISEHHIEQHKKELENIDFSRNLYSVLLFKAV